MTVTPLFQHVILSLTHPSDQILLTGSFKSLSSDFLVILSTVPGKYLHKLFFESSNVSQNMQLELIQHKCEENNNKLETHMLRAGPVDTGQTQAIRMKTILAFLNNASL
jgi:hypothetical protein